MKTKGCERCFGQSEQITYKRANSEEANLVYKKGFRGL